MRIFNAQRCKKREQNFGFCFAERFEKGGFPKVGWA